MKVLFGTNITENRKNTDTDCKELIIRTVPESYYDSFDEDAATENVSSDGKKRLRRLTKAVFLILLRIVLGVAAFASLAGVMVSIGEESEGIRDVIFSVKDNLLLFVSSSAVLCVSLLLLYRIKSAERISVLIICISGVIYGHSTGRLVKCVRSTWGLCPEEDVVSIPFVEKLSFKEYGIPLIKESDSSFLYSSIIVTNELNSS